MYYTYLYAKLRESVDLGPVHLVLVIVYLLSAANSNVMLSAEKAQSPLRDV